MSADGGSVRNTLGSQSSTSSSGSTNTESGARRRRDFQKKDRKIVRILTVVAYIVSVSSAAVILSAYYVFIWNPEPRAQDPAGPPGAGPAQLDGPRTLQSKKQLLVAPSPDSPPIRSMEAVLPEEPGSNSGEISPAASGAVAEPSFALSASQIDLRSKVRRKKKFYLHYVNTNTKAYQQHQIPTPPATLLMMTKRLTAMPIHADHPPHPTTPILDAAAAHKKEAEAKAT